MTASRLHIGLLGDSIFDNDAYTGEKPDVITHLRSLLSEREEATLCAVDGAMTTDVPAQLTRLPKEATHLVVSMGGNDALANSDLLDTPVRSTAEALRLFGVRSERFEKSYRMALDAVLRVRRPTTVCTIYNGNLPAAQAGVARVGLTVFNDVILRVAFERGLPVIDLRLVCSAPSDYANSIEPSGAGGAKIARAIMQTVKGTGGARPVARVSWL